MKADAIYNLTTPDQLYRSGKHGGVSVNFNSYSGEIIKESIGDVLFFKKHHPHGIGDIPTGLLTLPFSVINSFRTFKFNN